MIVIILLLCVLLSGCATPKQIEQHHHHHYEADTLAIQAAVDARVSSWHQQMDSAWRERMESFSMELYHSSHETELTTETITVSTDSAGRETRTEQRTISRDVSSEQRQLEQRLVREYEARIRVVVDSLNDVWSQRYELLQAHWEQSDSTSLTKTPVAQDSRPWYRRLFDRFHYFINGFLIAAVLWITRKFWLRLLLTRK